MLLKVVLGSPCITKSVSLLKSHGFLVSTLIGNFLFAGAVVIFKGLEKTVAK